MAETESMEERLEEWRETLHLVFMRLREVELPADFPFDCSAESLDRLETILLDRFPSGNPPPADTGFVDSVMGYLGEALMRIAGGHWDWDGDPASDTYDLPLACLDEALRLPPISPLRLVIEALRARTGRVFSRAHAELRTAVTDRQKQHPTWEPTKEHTLGVDVIDARHLPQHEWLVRWLAEREAAFDKWAADTGVDPDTWDFSTDSYDALEALVRQRLPTVDDFNKPEHQDFVQGAVWYLGEIPRRNCNNVVWRYHSAEPGSTGMYTGRPFVGQEPDGDLAVPIFSLQNAVEDNERGSLRKRFASFHQRS